MKQFRGTVVALACGNRLSENQKICLHTAQRAPDRANNFCKLLSTFVHYKWDWMDWMDLTKKGYFKIQLFGDQVLRY